MDNLAVWTHLWYLSDPYVYDWSAFENFADGYNRTCLANGGSSDGICF